MALVLLYQTQTQRPQNVFRDILEQHFEEKNTSKPMVNSTLPVSNYLFTSRRHHLIVLVDHFLSHLKTGFWKPWWNGFFHPQIGSQLIFTTQHFVRWWKPGTQSFTIGKAARGTWREWQPAYWNVSFSLVLQKISIILVPTFWFSSTNIPFSKKKRILHLKIDGLEDGP